MADLELGRGGGRQAAEQQDADAQDLDAANAAFWDELCGTGLAQAIGITGDEPDALQRFDRAYLDFYPYLTPYVDRVASPGAEVLEIGLGYGTLGTYLLDRGAHYHGLDIAEGPVRMMRHRARFGGGVEGDIVQGSVLAIPWPDAGFDAVISIGCLHHTGDLAGSVREVCRVLRPGGRALVMLYNRHSFRQLVEVPLLRLKERRALGAERVRALYDTNQAGDVAPHTDYVSRRDVRRLFSEFSRVEIDSRNFDHIILRGRVRVSRERLLGNLGRVLGLDLYIVARK